MTFKSYFFIFLLLIIISACSPVRVSKTKAAEGFNLTDYQTFNFFRQDPAAGNIPEHYQDEMDLIKAEIASHMKKNGLSLSSEPDLQINIGAVAEDKATTRETNIRDAPRYMGQRRYSWEREEIVVEEYTLGTVTVEIVGKEANQLLWKGVAKGVIPDDPEKLRKTIEEGVEKLFAKIPKEG